MNYIDEIRQVLFAAVADFQAVNYLNMLINWPNLTVVDIENQTDPFLQVELTFSGETELYDVEAGSDIIRGNLLVYFLYPENTGGNGSIAYSDLLRRALSNQKVGEITMKGMQIINVSPYPGIVGQMNVLSFII